MDTWALRRRHADAFRPLGAAGIIFDATILCALLVPALMRLMGDTNWWMLRDEMPEAALVPVV